MRTGRFSILVPTLAATLGASMAMGGCVSANDPTLLNPAGPPDLKQVLVTERMTGSTDTDLNITYGTHPDINNGQPNVVQATVVTDGQQLMHIVFDELLDGKTAEEFECACTTNCPTGHAWSIDPFDCSICGNDPTTTTDETGKCLDIAGGVADGLPDVSQLQPGLVHFACTSPTPYTYDTIETDGFYDPSGNQEVPYAEGIGGLGPSLILTPQTYFPTDSDCTIKIDPKVHDKDGNSVPASEVPTFHTEALGLSGNPSPTDGSVVDATAPGFAISVPFNSQLDVTSLTGFTVQDTTAGAAVDGATSLDPNSDGTTAVFTPTAVLPSGHAFVVTLTGITDSFGAQLPADITFGFSAQ